MPPTSPSAPEDALDFDGLDLKPSGAKAKTAESDFEKELEALFAEELASSDETPASAPPQGAPDLEDEPLLLDDLVPEASSAPEPEADEEILDLSAFGAGGDMDLTPPEDIPGGKDGDIDMGGLDDLISGLGESRAPAAVAEDDIIDLPEPLAEAADVFDLPPADAPLDDTDMADLLETLDVPKAVGKPAAGSAEPEDELLELSLGDLLEETPQAASPSFEAMAPAADDAGEPGLLDLTLPDLSDPDPGRDLLAEQEQADLGADLDLSLDILVEEPAAPAVVSDVAMEQLLETDDLGMGGLMEGIEASDGEPAPELSLDPQDLLAQIPDSVEPVQTAPVFETLAEPVFGQTLAAVMEPAAATPVEQDSGLSLPDMALGAAVAGAVAAGAALAPAPEPAVEAAPKPSPAMAASMSDASLADMQERLAQLSTQMMGNSVAVVRLEGKLAERDKTLAEMDERLLASQNEAQTLRQELAALRLQLEDSLRSQAEDVKQEVAMATQAAADKSQAAMDKALGAMDKALAALDKAQGASDKVDGLAPRVESAEMTVRGAGARLAQMEDRQSQLDREVFAEISRAVPREAAKVIREEIAHLAASLRDE